MIDTRFAFIEDTDKNRFQVLNEDGTDWDEEATKELFYQTHPDKRPQPIPVQEEATISSVDLELQAQSQENTEE